ncbi:hypothetical protein ACIBTV_25465 [Micromonospora sp. NPDC049366]|uniref:hypothetical protein n=1 Tax=Micromonospora sp. NPDC049366 TaxID=3364271 RepID=UPI0037AF6DFB
MTTTNLPVPVHAEQHRPATAEAEAEEERTGWCYNRHRNDTGALCPRSEKPAPEDGDEFDPCPDGCRKGWVVEACRTCGVPNDDGEGWDGECGNCADATERKRNSIDMSVLQQKVAASGHVALVDKTGGNTATLFAGRLVAGDDERPVRWSVSAGPGHFEEPGRAVAYRDEFGYGHDSNADDALWVSLYDDDRDMDDVADAIVKMLEDVERQRTEAGVPPAGRDAIVEAYGETVADAQERVYGRPSASEGAALPVPALREGEVWGLATLGCEDDGSDSWRAVYDPRTRWNGFLCPRFPRAEAERMRVYWDKAAAAAGPDAIVDTLRWDGDVLVLVSGQYNRDGGALQPGEQPDEDRIEPDERGLYAVGAYSWCWYEGDPHPVACAEVSGGDR